MLTWLEDRVLRDYRTNPLWVPGLGAARTLLAVGSLITVVLTDHRVLFGPAAGMPAGPRCEEPLGLSLFCVPGVPVGGLRLLAALILVVVASGWRPRWTCLPHWYVSWSVYATSTITDGGDQVTAVLALMLVPVCLADGRRWHWRSPAGPLDPPAWQVAVPVVTRLAVRVQLAVLYFQAAVSKFGIAQWADGTATYYWIDHPTFGAWEPLRGLLDAMATVPLLQAGLTWGPLVIELGIALAVFFGSRRVRIVALAGGFALHAGIALVMGIVSFSVAMLGALLLGLWWPSGSLRATTADPAPDVGRERAPERDEAVAGGDTGPADALSAAAPADEAGDLTARPG